MWGGFYYLTASVTLDLISPALLENEGSFILIAPSDYRVSVNCQPVASLGRGLCQQLAVFPLSCVDLAACQNVNSLAVR